MYILYSPYFVARTKLKFREPGQDITASNWQNQNWHPESMLFSLPCCCLLQQGNQFTEKVIFLLFGSVNYHLVLFP